MVGHSQQRFMICKSALTGLTALHDKILEFSDYRTVVDVLFLFKAFNFISQYILTSK